MNFVFSDLGKAWLDLSWKYVIGRKAALTIRWTLILIIPHVKIVSRDWLTKFGHSIMSTGEMSTGKKSTVLTRSTGSHCCFHWYFTKLGFVRYNKTNMPCKCGYPDGISPTLAWHICIMYALYLFGVPLPNFRIDSLSPDLSIKLFWGCHRFKKLLVFIFRKKWTFILLSFTPPPLRPPRRV